MPAAVAPADALVDPHLEQTAYVEKRTKQITDKTPGFGKRLPRLLVLIVVALLCYTGYVLSVLPHARLRATVRYDPSVGFRSELSSCDMVFIPGEEPNVYIESILEAGARPVFTWEGEPYASALLSIRVVNSAHSCERSVSRHCSDVCQMTVLVPPAAATSAIFSIGQHDNDRSTPLILFADIAAHSINIGRNEPTRSSEPEIAVLKAAHVVLRRCILSGALRARLNNGYVAAYDSRLPQATVIRYAHALRMTSDTLLLTAHC